MWTVMSIILDICVQQKSELNSLRPRLNRRPFADDIFKCIFLNENEWILPRISLKFVPKVRINNIPALIQIMAWRRPGDKPFSEPMMVSLLTHVCVTRSQCVKWLSIGNLWSVWRYKSEFRGTCLYILKEILRYNSKHRTLIYCQQCQKSILLYEPLEI